MDITKSDVERMVWYKRPTDKSRPKHEMLREATENAMSVFSITVPECPEAHKAMDKLQEALFWGNAAIARNHDKL